MHCYVTLSYVLWLMHTKMFIRGSLIRRAANYKVSLCFIVLLVTVYTVGYVCSFLNDKIFMNFVSFKFLSMIIYEVLYTLLWCLRHTICSAWFLKIVSVQTSACVFVCVYVCAPGLLITIGMMWGDMDPYNWLNKLYMLYDNCSHYH